VNAASQPGGYERCGAQTRSGGTCRLPAGHGTDTPGIGRCDHHGGSTPNHRIHAQRVQAGQACARLALPIRTTAADALREELWRCNGAVAWLAGQVAGLTAEELVWGTSERKIRNAAGGQGQPVVEVTQSARVHSMYQLYCRERDRLAQVAAEMERLGLEARAVQVAEVAGGRILAVLEAYAAELGHDPRSLGVRTAAVRALAAVPGA
jgi:hypothetical protein